MSFYFTFTTLQDIKQLRILVDFMASQDLDYPHYDAWLQRAENQFEREEKSAILGFSERKLVGDLVHQVCKDSGLGNLREIKNARVHPELRDRYFMSFMLRQLYVECKNDYDGLIVDVRANQTNTYDFFISQGFIPIMKIPLYETSMNEIVLFKPLKEESELIIPKVKKIIIAKSL